LHYIDSGQKPQQNAFIESFQRSLRDEFSREIFDTLDDCSPQAALWRLRFTEPTFRPHSFTRKPITYLLKPRVRFEQF